MSSMIFLETGQNQSNFYLSTEMLKVIEKGKNMS